MKMIFKIAIFLLLPMMAGQTNAQEKNGFTEDSLTAIYRKFAGKDYGSLIQESQNREFEVEIEVYHSFTGFGFFTHDPLVDIPWTWEKNPWKYVNGIGLNGKIQSQKVRFWANTNYSTNQLYEENPKFQRWFDSFTDSADSKLTSLARKVSKEKFIAICGEFKYKIFRKTNSLRESGVETIELEKLLIEDNWGKILNEHFLEMIEMFKKKMFYEIKVKELSVYKEDDFGVLPLK